MMKKPNPNHQTRLLLNSKYSIRIGVELRMGLHVVGKLSWKNKELGKVYVGTILKKTRNWKVLSWKVCAEVEKFGLKSESYD